MFRLLSHWVTTHPKKIIVMWIILLISSVIFALKLPTVLTAGGFNDPESESMRIQEVLQANFSNQYQQQLLVVVKSDKDTIKDPSYEKNVIKIKEAILQNNHVLDVQSYFDHKNESFLGKDPHNTFLLLGFNLSEDDTANLVPVLDQELKSKIQISGYQLFVTGGPALSYALNDATKKDLLRAEMVAFPLMIVILLIVFRSVASTILPLLMSGFALGITMAIAYFVAKDSTMNILLQNAISMIGLGVIVDYALFIISRYRQELERHNTVDAVRIAVQTAGKAVFFSGATVAVSLASLFLPHIMIFNSIALGGVVVVALAVLVSITLLPALLTVMGSLIHWGRIPLFQKSNFQAGWARWARLLLKRPVLFLIPALVFIAILGYPSYKLNMQVPVASASILPQEDLSRQGFDILANDFGQGNVFPIQVVLKAKKETALSYENLVEVNRVTEKIEHLSNVEKVLSITNWNKDWKFPDYQQAYKQYEQLPAAVKESLSSLINHEKGDNTTILIVSPKTDADSKESHVLVKEIRSSLSNDLFETYVGGQSAIGVDFDNKIFKHLPQIVLVVLIVSFLILVVSFRSILVPLKALILNCLVTLAAMGMLVVVFQNGDYRGAINSITPVVLFAVLFGLSMDYEVLIISRIREIYDNNRSTQEAVVQGIAETAGLVNGAAAIMIAVFGAFSLVQVEVVKELGFGLTVAILLDATIVRSVMVPTTLRLMGNANWWLPFISLSRQERRKVKAKLN